MDLLDYCKRTYQKQKLKAVLMLLLLLLFLEILENCSYSLNRSLIELEKDGLHFIMPLTRADN